MFPLLLVALAALLLLTVMAVVPHTRVAPWVDTTNGNGAHLATTPTIEDIDTWDEDYLDWVDNQPEVTHQYSYAPSEEFRPLVGDDPDEGDWDTP
jgi:hypothetical protein